jgi:hypothetical protein
MRADSSKRRSCFRWYSIVGLAVLSLGTVLAGCSDRVTVLIRPHSLVRPKVMVFGPRTVDQLAHAL